MLNLSDGIGKAIFLMALFLCLLGASQFLFLIFPSAIWSVVAFLIFGGFVCSMASLLPVSFILLLPYIFFRATTLISGIAIEYGGYAQDIETLGEPTGACVRLTAIYIIFVSFSAIVIEWGLRFIKSKESSFLYVRERTQRHPWVWFFYGVFILFSIYVLAVGFSNGFPLLDNIDRLAFREEMGGRWYILYMSNRMLAAYLFGVIIFLCHGIRRYMAVFLFVCMILISILFGEKFTSLLLLAIYVATPAYLMSKVLQGKILRQIIPAIFAVSLLTIPIILMVYGWSDRPQDAIERLSTRMVGQGEVWYVADRDTSYAFRADKKDLEHIFISTISPDADELVTTPPYTGVLYFMHNYMTPSMLSLFLKRPSLTLTFGFEPYLLVVFGWIGMLLPLCFYAGMFSFALLYLAWSITNARAISIFIAGKILIFMIVGLAQGYLFLIFGIKILLFFFIAIFYETVSSVLTRKNFVLLS